MTKAEAKTIKAGDKIIDRHGNEYTVLSVNEGWNGFLSSKQLEVVKDKPDFYTFCVSRQPWQYFNHKEVKRG